MEISRLTSQQAPTLVSQLVHQVRNCVPCATLEPHQLGAACATVAHVQPAVCLRHQQAVWQCPT